MVQKMWLLLVSSCVFNSQILHWKCGGKLSAIEFRLKLISQIIEKYGYNTDTFRKGGRPSIAENPFRLVEKHFPYYVPATEKKANATRRYAICKNYGARSQSRYECVRCDIGLCVAPCFERYHKVSFLNTTGLATLFWFTLICFLLLCYMIFVTYIYMQI